MMPDADAAGFVSLMNITSFRRHGPLHLLVVGKKEMYVPWANNRLSYPARELNIGPPPIRDVRYEL